ncbi:MAG: peptidase domain protein [Crocinitomicaceae bacterium]|jgi:predicted Zn-dependent peptidase|nr:peptidase domain protein [Crocinitomicaceae bacterium]
MLKRSIQPEIKEGESIHFVQPQAINIGPHTSIFYLDQVKDETVRIELSFNAGQIHGHKNVASFVSALLLSGTPEKTSEQIHEELDFLGAYVDHEISMESAFIHLFCLRKNVYAALEILVDALENASFPEQEIQDMLQEKKQRYLVSNEKVNFLARKEFQKQLFSGAGAYARQMEMEDFLDVKQSDLLDFHHKFYLQSLRKVVVVGNLGAEIIPFLSNKLSAWSQPELFEFIPGFHNEPGRFHVEKKGALQTAIRFGVPMFNKQHPDYFDFVILQTILGDYFGSRLMSNIREDKGYTYGIGCALVELKRSGYFVIATEVAKDVTEATIREIKYEIDRLQNELVPQEELELVKNYMLGQLLKSADGPNAMMDLFLGVEQHQMTLTFYNEYINNIKSVTPEQLKEIAIRCLNWDQFTLITAGERN